MINKITYSVSLAYLVAGLLAVSSCKRHSPGHGSVEAPPASQPLKRFEHSLFTDRDSLTGDDIRKLRGEYGLFFDLYCKRVVRITDTTDEVTAGFLTHFVNDPDLRMLKSISDSIYSDFSDMHERLNAAFGRALFYFPDWKAPMYLTCLSAFNYQVITTDEVLAISLDMYLGSDRGLMYSSVGFPAYMSMRFSKEYIVPDCMKGWFQSEYDIDSVRNELLSQMIYYGKMYYFLDLVLPDAPDTVKSGYTAAQLEWCNRNEANIWAHFIEQELLFSTDQHSYFKYLNDGPSTSSLPNDSPARLGQWVGWRIVRSWAEAHPGLTPAAILAEQDAQRILHESAYKPEL